MRAATDRPFGVNLFVPGAEMVSADELATYRRRLASDGARYGVEPGMPREDPGDDGWEDKLALAVERGVPVISFTFGCPPSDLIDDLHAANSAVWVTVNNPDEAELAADAGADVLTVQGIEAGGHQGGWLHRGEPDGYGLLALIQVVRRRVELPLVGAGGIGDGAAIAAVIAAGARAAQLGTAFLCSPEAGTDPTYRAALRAGGITRATRAFSGRLARGMNNRFITDHDSHAPAAFPAVQQMTGPLRAAARAAGDPDGLSLWAGQAHALAARDLPAGEIVRRLQADARRAARAAADALGVDVGT